MATTTTSVLALLILSQLSLSLAVVPAFRDVTPSTGIDLLPEGPSMPRLLKYGGPTIADLDGDGHYDLLLIHHGPQSAELYFSNGDGTFTKSSFRSRRDNHALNPFRVPLLRERFFTLIPGGNNGFRPNPPVVFRINRDRTVTNVTAQFGLGFFTARGRSSVFMPLQRKTAKPDVLYMNAEADPIRCPGCTDGPYDPYEYVGRGRLYRPRRIRGFQPSEHNDRVLAIDYDGDGAMELLTWRELTIHRLVGYFRFKDVSKKVLGENAYLEGVAAVVELDFDNDGDFDLYIARDKSGRRIDVEGQTFSDLLLENRGGVFVNVAKEAGVPQDTISRGVTVGDFNNDGWMDIYVSVLRGKPDVLLLNNGDRTFRSVDIGIGKQGAWGDNAMAVDYDNDGRVDLIRSEGDWSKREVGGQFRILRNVRNPKKLGRWVKVRVGSAGRQTSLHALVVVVAGGKRMVRRVGPAGASVGHSFLDTLHFGIGRARRARVTVRWLNGVTRRRGVRAGVLATFGRY